MLNENIIIIIIIIKTTFGCFVVLRAITLCLIESKMNAAALDPSAVLDALIRACSQDAQVLKPAEHQLKSWESQPGFYSILAVTPFMFSYDEKWGSMVRVLDCQL